MFRMMLRRHPVNTRNDIDYVRRIRRVASARSFRSGRWLVPWVRGSVAFRGSVGAVGAFTTHIDDVLGCGEPAAS